MSRLYNDTIDYLLDCTNKEVLTLLYLFKRQTPSGCVNGVHNQDLIRETGMSKASFYNTIHSLEKKNYLDIIHIGNMYIVNLKINIYPEDEYDELDEHSNPSGTENTQESINNSDNGSSSKRGYINLNRQLYSTEEFINLPAKAKWLMLTFLVNTSSSGVHTTKRLFEFYEKMCRLTKRTRRRIKSYITLLRRWFNVTLKNGKYIIGRNLELKKLLSNKIYKNEKTPYRTMCVKASLRMAGFRRVVKTKIDDIVALCTQYRNNVNVKKRGVEVYLISAILEHGREKPKSLSVPRIHQLLREKLTS